MFISTALDGESFGAGSLMQGSEHFPASAKFAGQPFRIEHTLNL
jgi:hypothetical protein